MTRILTGPDASYLNGAYKVLTNPWGDRDFGYSETITIANDSDLSGGIQMQWDWDGGGTSVLAYPEISVGFKPWDHDTAQDSTVLSSKIQDLKTFDISADYTITGDTSNFDVAYDLWLTNAPAGDENTVTTELMIWTHKYSPLDFGTDSHTGQSAVVGTYTYHKITFDLVKYEDFSTGTGQQWRYLALVPAGDTDLTHMKFDVKDILDNLIDRGYVSQNDYVTGFELGAEVLGGSGSLDVNDLSFKFDRYDADNGDNKLVGTSGSDRIYGLGGDDTIVGKAGSDWLVGGRGGDTLRGGQGADTFVFDILSKGPDTIVDFKPGTDHIDLESRAFKALVPGDLPDHVLKIGNHFDADARLLYKEHSGKLYYDGDGSGTAQSAHLIAVLENHATLASSDFFVL